MTLAENSWPALSEHAERLCDAFETQWKARAAPRLEEVLVQVSESERPALLYELLLIEWEYRQKQGDPPRPGEYAPRFAEAANVVSQAEAVFSRRQRLNHPAPGSDATQRALTPDATAAFAASAPAAVPQEPLWVGSVSIPRRLGDYDLLEELGIGGMGIVFRARQRRAARLVALKLVRPDKLTELPAADREAVLARFRQEAEAAARLEHDHAVTVYEVGCAAGFHYYSMRLVEGESLADRLQRGPLEPAAAAELLEGVARAVEEGHRLGIVHRDLKPRNILLEQKSGRALVTDFGLAKLLETDSELTRTGEVFGSPPYMAPEQALSAATVTSAVDTYALGATLYHALTGRPPFQAATVLQTLRQVVEDDPVPPRKLNRAVPRDLETICLKCLEKEPARRYPSAAAFANELQAFRTGRPIQARPAGRLDRAWRWCRRNPLSASLAAAAALLLCGVLTAVSVGYVVTARALAREQAERAQARENLQLAFRSVDLFFSNLSEDPRLKARGLESLRRELLTAATGFFELMVQQGNDPRIAWERARAYGRLAHIGAELREHQQAAATYRQALDVLTALEADAPAESSATGDEAPPTLTEVRELKALYLERLGALEMETGAMAAAEEHVRAAERLARELVQANSERFDAAYALAESQFRLAEFQFRQNELPAAQENYAKTERLCEQLGRQHSGRLEARELLGKTQTNEALIARRRQQLGEAIRLSAAASSTYAALLAQAPDNTSYQALAALAEMNLGAYQRAHQQHSAAEATLRQALHRYESLVREHPEVPDLRAKKAATQSNLASALQDRGYSAEAESLYRAAMESLGELVASFPNDTEYPAFLDAAWNNYGTLLEQQGNAAAAKEAYDRAVDTFTRLAALEPENPAHAARLAGVRMNRGRNLVQSHHPEEGAVDLGPALAAYERLLAAEPKNERYLESYATACTWLAICHAELRAYKESEAAWRKAIEARHTLRELATHEQHAERLRTECAAHGALARLCYDQRNYAAALQEYEFAAEHAAAREAWNYRALAALAGGMLGDATKADHWIAEGELPPEPDRTAVVWLHFVRAWSASALAARTDKDLLDKDRDTEIQRRLDTAMKALERAQAGGELDDEEARRAFDEDPALAPLRESAAFHAWSKKHGKP